MGKIDIQHLCVDLSFKAVQHGNGAKIGGKYEASLYESIIQGLLAHPVTHQIQDFLLLVVKRDAKHPLAHGDRFLHAVVLHCLQQNLRVGASPEGRHLLLIKQSFCNFLIVIDFSIIGDHIAAAVGNHGLGPLLRQVHNGKASVAEYHRPVR